MRSTLEIQCLLEAIADYAETMSDYRKARDSYDGYSWGYHGQYEIERLEKASENVAKYLDKYIEERVRKIMETA